MSIQKLNVIPKPSEGTRLVLKLNEGVNLIIAVGDTSMQCGSCMAMLMQNIDLAKLGFINTVFYCDWCGSYNEIP